MDEGRRRLDSLCRRSVEMWGLPAQETKLIEECGELIVALAKLHCRFNGSCLEDVAEEMGDVELMIHQIKRAHGLEAKVEEWREKKLKRLERQLNEA